VLRVTHVTETRKMHKIMVRKIWEEKIQGETFDRGWY